MPVLNMGHRAVTYPVIRTSRQILSWVAKTIFVATLTAACAPTPIAEPTLKSMDLVALCQGYARSRQYDNALHQAQYMNELIARRAISTAQKRDVEQGLIQIGQPEHIAVCAWGPYYDINTSTGMWGVHRQYVLGDFGPYFYTQNGRVTSWQD